MKLKDRLIRWLGGYTPAEWQREISAMRGARGSLYLGAVRLLPIRVECRQILRAPVYGNDKLTRENMAYKLAACMLERGLIAYEVEENEDRPPELRARVTVYPPEEGST